ncbi:MAG: FAD-binding protein, partial [Deltaproteobacteria bacterium]|nr:FAD-binding protein [Deltaproteobacteria bacterium]
YLLASRIEPGVVVQGRRGSWTPVHSSAAPSSLALDLAAMDGEVWLDTGRWEVTAPGWMLASELHALLSAHGLQVSHIPTWCHATLAGLVGTGSHGAARDSESIAEAVTAMDLLDARGQRWFLDARGLRLAATGVTVLIGPKWLRHGRVHLGSLGIVTSLTFSVRPERFLCQTQRLYPAEAMLGAGLRAHLRDNEHASLAWGIRQGRCVARAANQSLPVPKRAALVSDAEAWFTHALPTAVMCILSRCAWLADTVNGWLLAPRLLRSSVIGPAWQVLTYMPGRLTPRARLRTMEYEVPLDRLDEVVDLYGRLLSGAPNQIPVNFRRAGDKVFVEYMWCAGFRGGLAHAQAVERALVERLGADALPHPGKLHWINPWTRLSAQRRRVFLGLRAILDPEGAFENAYVSWLLGNAEPGAHPSSWVRS